MLEYVNQTPAAPGGFPAFFTIVVDAIAFQSETTLPARSPAARKSGAVNTIANRASLIFIEKSPLHVISSLPVERMWGIGSSLKKSHKRALAFRRIFCRTIGAKRP